MTTSTRPTPIQFWTVFYTTTSKAVPGLCRSYSFDHSEICTDREVMLETVQEFRGNGLQAVLETTRDAQGFTTKDITDTVEDEACEFAFNSMSAADQDEARAYDKWKEYR